MKYRVHVSEDVRRKGTTVAEFDDLHDALDFCRRYPVGYVKEGEDVVYLRSPSGRGGE